MVEATCFGESLLRAVYRRDEHPNYWKKDGTISSAVFKDSKGVSVNAQMDLTIETAVAFCISLFPGRYIFSVPTETCLQANCYIKPDKLEGNAYHCLIYGSEELTMLKTSQARELKEAASMQYDPTLKNYYPLV